MPEYLAPGVYVEEVSSGIKPIEGVSTSTAGFLGRTERGPAGANFVTSFTEYQRLYGGFQNQPAGMYLPHAVKGFFDNGGRRAFISRTVVDGLQAAEANATTATEQDSPTLDIFTVKANGPGAWGTRVYVLLQPSSQVPQGGGQNYRLTIAYFQKDPLLWSNPLADARTLLDAKLPRPRPEQFEDFDGLRDAAEIVSVVNGRSQLVRIERPVGATMSQLPPVAAATRADLPWVRLQGTDNQETKFKTGRSAVKAALDVVKTGKQVDEAAEATKAKLDKAKAAYSRADAAAARPGLDQTVATDAKEAVKQAKVAIDKIDEVSTEASKAFLAARAAAKNTRMAAEAESSDATTAAAKVSDLANQASTSIDKVTAAKTAADTAITAATTAGNSAATKAAALTDQAKAIATEVTTTISGAIELISKAVTAAAAIATPATGAKTGITALSQAAIAAAAAQMPAQSEDAPTFARDYKHALDQLELVDGVSIVVTPEHVTDSSFNQELVSSCERLADRVVLLSVTADMQNQTNPESIRHNLDSTFAAFYHPWIKVTDPLSTGALSEPKSIPAIGHIAGILARTDITRGVHKAPANEVVLGALNLSVPVNKGQQDILNPKGVNCIRDFRPDNRGIRLWGARTTSSDSEWKYLNVRRLFLFLEKSIDQGTQWVVFEPNSDPTWAAVRRNISNFLLSVWRSGALLGTKPEEAFYVRCDRTTMTEDDILNGRLICIIGVAPVRPAEFVIIRISQMTAEAKS